MQNDLGTRHLLPQVLQTKGFHKERFYEIQKPDHKNHFEVDYNSSKPRFGSQ